MDKTNINGLVQKGINKVTGFQKEREKRITNMVPH